MGRLHHLERLALGRSAFQEPLDENVPNEFETWQVSAAGQDEPQTSGHRAREYDSKGRPINSATEDYNQAMRNAQNAVLSLVGVVESKETTDRELESKHREIRQKRQRMLEAEQDRGEDFELLAPLLDSLLTWWPENSISRVQAGMFAAARSAVDALFGELAAALSGRGSARARAVLAVLFHGLPAWMLFYIVKTLLAAAVGEGVGQLQERLNRRLSRRTLKRVNRFIMLGADATLVAVDVALLPLQYFAFAQSLGLAPAWPVLPNWRFLLPWTTTSAHSLLWQPTTGTSSMAMLTSPAVFMLVQNFIERDQVDGLPIAYHLTTFEYPPINARTSAVQMLGRAVHRDPFGQLLYRGYLIRSRLLRWFGWNIESAPEQSARWTLYENDHVPKIEDEPSNETERNVASRDGQELGPRHRSTSLAHRPAQYLADKIDTVFTRLLTMPLESTVIRTITQTYLSSELPKTTLALAAAPFVYFPFGGGPFGTLRRMGSSAFAWREVANYVNRLGLSLALNTASEIGVFFILYRLIRWQGMRNFDWGGGSRLNRDGDADD